MKNLLLFVVCSFLLTLTRTQAQDYSYNDSKVIPLRTNYYYTAQDNVTNTKEGKVSNYDSNQQQYQYSKFEGFIFPTTNSLNSKEMFTSLNLYYDNIANDYVAISDEKEDYVIGDGSNYQFVENLGYIYKKAEANTTPLVLYWNDQRKDYFTSALQEGKNNAINGGYQEIATVGYVLIPGNVSVYFQGYNMIPLQTNYYYESQDNVTNTQGGKVPDRNNQKQWQYSEIEGYIISGFDGEFYDKSEIAEYCLYYNETDDDYETIVRDEEWYSEDTNKKFVKILGYVFLKPHPNTRPLQNFWSGSRRDHFTTASDTGAKTAINTEYQRLSNKGYVLYIK